MVIHGYGGVVTRHSLIAGAAKRWQETLVDDSGRNQLAYYRDLKVGTLALEGAHEPHLAQLTAGRPVALRHLFPQAEAHADAMKRMRAVRTHMRMWAEERGVEVGYLVTGLATWQEPGRTPRAPVLLQRLAVRPASALHLDFILDADPEPSVNPVLLHKLSKDFGVSIAQEELEELSPDDLFDYLAKAALDVPGFAIERRHLIGTFTYAKLPMVDDIGDSHEVMAGHDVISALAGDREALTNLAAPDDLSVDVPDHVSPADEFIVLDADSSQSRVVNSVLSGHHLVIKGPPGTGKSQTIANIIAALAANGRTALFVAEKRAAIDAVLDRLQHVGLDDLVHNLHGEQQSRRELARSLDARLHRARTEAQPSTDDNARRLGLSRDALVRHHAAMHLPREPWGFSVYNMQAGLVGLPPTPVRWSGESLRGLHGETVHRVRAAVAELARIPTTTAWLETTIADRASAQAAYGWAGQAVVQWPRAQQAVARLVAELGFAPANNISAMQQAVQLASDVQATLEAFEPEIYEADLSRWDGFLDRWRTKRRMRALALRRVKDLRAVAAQVADQRSRWSRVAVDGGGPRVAASLPEAQESLGQAVETLRQLHAVLPVEDLTERLTSLAPDQRGLLDAVRRNELLAVIGPYGTFASADEFDHAWLSSILDEVRFSDEHLARFQSSVLHERAGEFRAADAEHLALAAARVRHAAAMHMIRVLDEFPEQQRLVRNEAAKKARHLTVRKLFEQAPQALTALKPCWAMSPLLASQVLPAQTLFDVVIFDEASQVEPVDAITAIMRGRQIVVAGDEHQLPPTSFFDRAPVDLTDDVEPEETLPTDDIESLLQSFANTLPLRQVRHLSWHYRSRDERLIAFSNRHIYAPNGNELVTFPGADTLDCLRHVLAGEGESEIEFPRRTADTADPPRGSSTSAEVDTVVRLILEHAEQRPNESLGVITMGVKHADLIDAALHKALAKRPELAAFFTESGLEPYFIKNIERVQGDERDAIIMSVGYSKGPDGRMRYLFGPLNQKGGERRLNVAVTRAKRRLTLVSSFTFLDMDPNKLKAAGAQLLRSYLEYVQLGGISDSRNATVNAFEAEVRDRLVEAGVPVEARFGVDFAAKHLAIETDGTRYHSSPTARDRDRLRQQHLERLGWRYHRIWSIDWFADREGEIARVVRAYEEALAQEPEPVPAVEEVVVDKPPQLKTRGPKPELPPFDAITDLPDHVLAELVKWVESDGLNRTEEEVITETIAELGFTRRGTRIVEAVKRARQLTK